MGQSAGAHIAACALLEQAIKESGEGESTTWSVSQIKAYFGLSGGYVYLSSTKSNLYKCYLQSNTILNSVGLNFLLMIYFVYLLLSFTFQQWWEQIQFT